MKTSKIFFACFIVFMLCWVLYLFKPFLLTISIGILLAVSTSDLHYQIRKLTNHKRTLSAILTTLVLCCIFFVPFIYAVIAIFKNAANLDATFINQTVNFVKNYDFSLLPSPLNKFEENIREFVANLDFGGIAKQGAMYLSTLGKSSAKFITDMGLIIIFYFFTNLYGKDFLLFVRKSTPIGTKQLNYMFSQTANTMSVVFYSTIFNAILQGFLFSIIAGIYGHDAVLMGIVFAFSSLIPAIGGALVYVPTAIFQLANGNTGGAIIILIYCVVLISIIADSFVKPLVIKFINSKLVTNSANINELLIFFSMLSGIATFGFWGVVLGPAILTLFIAVLKLYSHLKEKDFM